MSKVSLEWSSPAGLRVLAVARHRLLAALASRGPGEALPRAEAELLRALAGDGAGALADVGPRLIELTQRATGPARVESTLGEHLGVATEISASGRLVTRVLAEAPAELVTRHRRAVAAALHARVALLRTAIATAELAALIAVASPAAAGIALPIAWGFLHNLLTERLASSDGE